MSKNENPQSDIMFEAGCHEAPAALKAAPTYYNKIGIYFCSLQRHKILIGMCTTWIEP